MGDAPLSEPNPIQIRRLDHVVLRIRDLEASLRFWRDALGCPVERSSDALGLYQLRAGDSLIDLVLRTHRNLYGLPAVEELHEALREAGFAQTGEVQILAGGAVRFVWGSAAA